VVAWTGNSDRRHSLGQGGSSVRTAATLSDSPIGAVNRCRKKTLAPLRLFRLAPLLSL
jgi:hypothetical protein